VHILIPEIALSGHHANYLEHIARLFLSQGHRVTVSVRDTELGHSVLAQLRARYPEGLRTKALPPADRPGRWLSTKGIAGGELAAWWTFRRFFRELNRHDPVDRVFYPYLDYCLHATAWLGPPSGSTPWAGICMRPSFHLRRSGVVAPVPKFAAAKEWLFHRLLTNKGLQAVLTIDELLWRDTCTKRPGLASRLHYMADPAYLCTTMDRSGARTRLGLGPDDFVILVYGAIDNRKGIDLLLNGLRNRDFPKQVRVLTVGKHTAALRQSLAQEPLVTSLDGYADDITEEAAFRAADIVWLGYRSHYAMSGVLILAAIAGVPVIATHQGLIGWVTREHDLGDVINAEDASAVTESVLRRTGISFAAPSLGMNTVSSRHTWDEAMRHISNGFGVKEESRE
jgi:glycosyltransferase involved in cell wall biosynthesis